MNDPSARLGVALATLVIACAATTVAFSATRPNVLFIVSDDQRPDTVGALGNPHIHTPNLDSLVLSGAAFTRAVASTPICTPSRAAIITGCDGFGNGVRDFGRKITPGLTLWGDTMRRAGYHTWYVGKWHNDGRPARRGYEESRRLFAGGGGRWWTDRTDEHGRPVTGYRGWVFQSDDGTKFPEKGVGLSPDISRKFADAAIGFIRRKVDRPFFLHVNFTAPHDPLLLPPGHEKEYSGEELPLPSNFLPEHPFDHGNLRGRDEKLRPWPRTPADVRADLAVYYAVISHMDEQIGRILATLRDTGQWENTIVVFTSDHGLAMGSHGLRGKQNMYEHTIGVPFLLRGPGIPRGRQFDAQVCLRDLYPTVCELVDIDVPESVDGKSLVAVLSGITPSVRDHVFCHYRDTQRMIRTDRWKLIHYPLIDHFQLFDLDADPFEVNNLSASTLHAGTLADLRSRLIARQRFVDDPAVAAPDFASAFPDGVERPWAGREYWTNPMEDWRLAGGRLEVVRSGPDRNVHILTRQLARHAGTLEMTVVIGRADGGKAPRSAGFRFGIRSELGDHRSAVLHGRGVDAGIGPDGALFIDSIRQSSGAGTIGDAAVVELKLTVTPAADGHAVLLEAIDHASGERLGTTVGRVNSDRCIGNLALVNDYPTAGRRHQRRADATGPRHWLDDWRISGSKVVARDDRARGPILFAMHTLSRGVMKMTAQMPPLAATDSRFVDLDVLQGHVWRTIATARIDSLARTATFRIENWDSTRNTKYRLVHELADSGSIRRHFWTGTVRRDPVDRELVVAGFTGNTDRGFPNAAVVGNVTKHNPDVLVFTGDQIYEGVGGYGIHRSPVELATLNYLRKWYLFGWAFGDLMRDRVTLCLPDDHDVYQGNIWGNGGNAVTIKQHARGGYAMPPEWVNMVQRTQTGHHPDPFDPRPIEQDIGVYYGELVYGRVSFAIIEDRKFKSGPEGTIATWSGRPDHVKDPDFDPRSIDRPGLTLLGERQLDFLREWAADWRGADMKIVCSQTIFCNLANYHGREKTFLVADLDSNGWPQSGRDRALRELRRCFAFHLAGDQHLPSIVQHGIDAFRDAGYSFCVPSIAAGYPRSWLPDREGRPVLARPPGGRPNTGDYRDGLGNRLTVHAIGNPAETNRPGVLETLHDKSSGYGIVRLDTERRTITMECWRLLADVEKPTPQGQFPGWPRTIDLLENDGRRALDHLPTIHLIGAENPVVQITDESNDNVLYTLRIRGATFRPKIFKRGGSYTITVRERGTDRVKTLRGIVPGGDRTLEVSFAAE